MKMPEFSIRCMFSLAAASLLAAPLHAQDLVGAGAGSYTTRLPAGAKEPAETPFITSNVKGPVPTNDWWSSLVFQKFSNQMFPHPLWMMIAAVVLPLVAVLVAKKLVAGQIAAAFPPFM